MYVEHKTQRQGDIYIKYDNSPYPDSRSEGAVPVVTIETSRVFTAVALMKDISGEYGTGVSPQGKNRGEIL